MLISLKAYDETASIRVLLYSNNFVDMPPEQLEQLNVPQPSKAGTKNKNGGLNEISLIKYVNRVVSEIKIHSVLSMENASAILINNAPIARHSPGFSQSLHLVMNLDNKYSKLQVYNKKKIAAAPADDLSLAFQASAMDEDENDLADFLSDLPIQQI